MLTEDNIINDPNTQRGDQSLFVRFYKKAVQAEFKSEQAGRPIFQDEIHVRIQAPGDNLQIEDRPMYPSDKLRFPRQWMQFEAVGRGESMADGTPIGQWPLVTMSQAEELKAAGFATVELVAAASDAQVQSFMGGTGLRAKAQAYLAAAKDSSLVQRQAAELERRDQQIADLTEKLARMGDQIEALSAEKRGPGRPRKEQVAA